MLIMHIDDCRGFFFVYIVEFSKKIDKIKCKQKQKEIDDAVWKQQKSSQLKHVYKLENM